MAGTGNAIVLIRHGGAKKGSDPALSETGERALAAQLARLSPLLDDLIRADAPAEIWTSPALRCRRQRLAPADMTPSGEGHGAPRQAAPCAGGHDHHENT